MLSGAANVANRHACASGKLTSAPEAMDVSLFLERSSPYSDDDAVVLARIPLPSDSSWLLARSKYMSKVHGEKLPGGIALMWLERSTKRNSCVWPLNSPAGKLRSMFWLRSIVCNPGIPAETPCAQRWKHVNVCRITELLDRVELNRTGT